MRSKAAKHADESVANSVDQELNQIQAADLSSGEV